MAGDAWPLTCSVCDRPLARSGGSFRCTAGHSFDRSSEGYVNLLAASDRERGIEGDTLDMLRARRRFLDAGHFEPLLGSIRTDVAAALDESETTRGCVLEAGCGEGYYIRGLGLEARLIGMDISKPAVRLAAQRYGHATFAVANVRRRLYVASGSVHALLSIFAPRNAAEFARVVAPGGSVIVAIPTESHMESVRRAYDMIGLGEAKEERILDQLGAEFRRVSRRTLEYDVRLSAAAVRDFVLMGPTARHIDARDVERAAELDTRASFVLLRLRRTAPDEPMSRMERR